MIKDVNKISCKHCGSSLGFESVGKFMQYYNGYGEEDGYEICGVISNVVKCRNCGYKTTRKVLQNKFNRANKDTQNLNYNISD